MPKQRRIITSLLVIMVALTAALTAGACGKQSYGEAYDSLAELREAVENAGVTLLYPAEMGAKDNESTDAFVSVLNPASGKTEGYKIYNFGAPFFVSVNAYHVDGGALISDDAGRLTKEENLATAKGEAELYTGKGHKDALFLIGVVVLDGKRYEVRVTANKKLENGSFVNAIYKDNAKYPEALDVLKRVIEGLEA